MNPLNLPCVLGEGATKVTSTFHSHFSMKTYPIDYDYKGHIITYD